MIVMNSGSQLSEMETISHLNFIFVFKNLLTWGSPQLERSVLNSETWEERSYFEVVATKLFE